MRCLLSFISFLRRTDQPAKTYYILGTSCIVLNCVCLGDNFLKKNSGQIGSFASLLPCHER